MPEAVAQFGKLIDLQAGVVGDEQEGRSLQLRLEIVNDGGFFGFMMWGSVSS